MSGQHWFVIRCWSLLGFSFGYADCACGWTTWGRKDGIHERAFYHAEGVA